MSARFHSRSFISLVALLFLAASLAGAQQQKHRVTLDIKDLEVTKAIEMLFKITGYNRVVADGVEGDIAELTLEDTDWQLALKTILEQVEAVYTIDKNGVYQIKPKPVARRVPPPGYNNGNEDEEYEYEEGGSYNPGAQRRFVPGNGPTRRRPAIAPPEIRTDGSATTQARPLRLAQLLEGEDDLGLDTGIPEEVAEDVRFQDPWVPNYMWAASVASLFGGEVIDPRLDFMGMGGGGYGGGYGGGGYGGGYGGGGFGGRGGFGGGRGGFGGF